MRFGCGKIWSRLIDRPSGDVHHPSPTFYVYGGAGGRQGICVVFNVQHGGRKGKKKFGFFERRQKMTEQFAPL